MREKRRLRVFENRALRRIFGPKLDGEAGKWRKLHNEELNALYSSPNIVWVVIKRRDGRGMYHVWGKGEVYIGFWWGNLREREHLGDPGMDLQEVGC